MGLNRQLLHLVLAVLVTCMSLYAIDRINQQPLPPNAIEIEHTLALYTDATEPVADAADWREQALPDDWFRRAGNGRFKWYRFNLPLSRFTPAPWAIYLTHTSRPAALYINGQRVFEPEQRPLPMGRVWNQPQLIVIEPDSIPGAIFKVQLRVARNQSDSGMVGRIYVGPEAVLNGPFERAYFSIVRLPRLLVYAMLLGGIFMLMVWLFRRSDTVYAYYFLAILAWAIYSYAHIPLWLPISDQLWDWLRMTSLHWWPTITVVFCNRILGQPQPRIELAFVAWGVCLTTTTLFLDANSLYWLADFILPATALLVGLYPTWRMLAAMCKRHDPHITWLTLSGVQVLLLSLHDILILGHWIPPWQWLYLHDASLLLAFVFGTILLKRFVDTFNEAEALNVELEQRVRDKTNELAGNYQRLRKLERESVLADERERIMRDMHDGVGGSLVSMRAALQRGVWSAADVSEGLGEALDDLYLMIHSLDPYGDDLTIALGSVRHRLEDRLRRANIRMNWHVGELPLMPGLGPEVVLQIMRIMQEAVANAVKHSGAEVVEIHIGASAENTGPGTIFVEITDNGRGLGAAHQRGHGLEGMYQRANRMGAQLSISSVDPGTKIRLHFDAPGSTVLAKL